MRYQNSAIGQRCRCIDNAFQKWEIKFRLVAYAKHPPYSFNREKRLWRFRLSVILM